MYFQRGNFHLKNIWLGTFQSSSLAFLTFGLSRYFSSESFSLRAQLHYVIK